MIHNRRQFIKTLVAGGMAATLPLPLSANTSNKNTLTILHTNDVHSHLEPFDASHPNFPNLGGFARRATLINRLREENENILLLDAGDIFQGTPYFNFFGGEPEIKLMSDMQYDAATIGNHEFDNGLEHLSTQIKKANFPFICSNYDFSKTIMEGQTKPWHIIEKGPFRVGILGLGVNPSGLVSPVHYEGMKWLNPISAGEETAAFLKSEKGCNIVIALTHIGLESTPEKPESDKKLAAETRSIDLIIGGHSHTFLNEPELITNKDGKLIPVNQVGWAGVKLGQINVKLQQKKHLSFNAVQHIIR